jgi:hypothetical protein
MEKNNNGNAVKAWLTYVSQCLYNKIIQCTTIRFQIKIMFLK